MGYSLKHTGSDITMAGKTGYDITTIADDGMQPSIEAAYHLSSLQISFIVVGALFLAVIILGAFNAWIHSQEARRPCWSNIMNWKIHHSEVTKRHTLKMNPNSAVFIV